MPTLYPIAKRSLDLAVSIIAMPFAVPLCAILMIVIRLESEGSPLFAQRRVGRHQRPFTMFKLRTMAMNTGDLPSHLVGGHHVTKVGRILRRLKFDELPQLINVAAGSMSLVGPRPCLPSQHELIQERAARDVFRFAPGVTGPAQLAGIDMSQPRRLAEVEAGYFGTASMAQDIKVILHTAIGKGSGDAIGKPNK